MAQSAQWNLFMSIFNGFRFRSIAIGAVALLVAPVAAQAGQINLTITGARNADGIVRCGLFASAAGFRQPGKEASESTGKVSGGRASCSFKSVPNGTYAVAVFHAERGERTMDIGLFGKPKQGVGFSRNPSIAFGPPGFDAAAFTVGAAPVDLTIKLNY
jgi:uncharacterized protein (DUF2141 family)